MELRARLDRLLARREEVRELRMTLRARDLLFDIFQEVSSALRAEEIFQTLVRRVGQALSLSHCSFVVTSPGADHGRVVAVYENPSVRDMRVELARYPEIQEALRTERPVVIEDVKEHPLFASIRDKWDAQAVEVNIRSAVALPVFVQGTPAGVFFLRTREGDPELTSRDIALADTIAKAAAKVLENEEKRAAMFRRQLNAGALDVLTGCASLDGLDRRLRDEYERARRYRLRFCFAVLDVDHFRTLNERLGAQAGDRILADLGQLLQRELRSPDFVARYGGDEFALVLPETDARGARNFVQRLGAAVAKHGFPDMGGDRPTFSAGIVLVPASRGPAARRPLRAGGRGAGAGQGFHRRPDRHRALAGELDRRLLRGHPEGVGERPLRRPQLRAEPRHQRIVELQRREVAALRLDRAAHLLDQPRVLLHGGRQRRQRRAHLRHRLAAPFLPPRQRRQDLRPHDERGVGNRGQGTGDGRSRTPDAGSRNPPPRHSRSPGFRIRPSTLDRLRRRSSSSDSASVTRCSSLTLASRSRSTSCRSISSSARSLSISGAAVEPGRAVSGDRASALAGRRAASGPGGGASGGSSSVSGLLPNSETPGAGAPAAGATAAGGVTGARNGAGAGAARGAASGAGAGLPAP